MLALLLLLVVSLSAFGIVIASRMRSMPGFQVVMNFLRMPSWFAREPGSSALVVLAFRPRRFGYCWGPLVERTASMGVPAAGQVVQASGWSSQEAGR